MFPRKHRGSRDAQGHGAGWRGRESLQGLRMPPHCPRFNIGVPRTGVAYVKPGWEWGGLRIGSRSGSRKGTLAEYLRSVHGPYGPARGVRGKGGPGYMPGLGPTAWFAQRDTHGLPFCFFPHRAWLSRGCHPLGLQPWFSPRPGGEPRR